MTANTNTTVKLDFIFIDTHSLKSIAIVDTSTYPTGFNVNSPTLQVTPPGNDTISIDFATASIQVLKASHLGIVCEWCEDTDLPDGIWTFKYSIHPAYKYYVEKTYAKIDRLQAKFDEVYLQLDLTECDEKVSKANKEFLSIVENYMEGAVAAGNKCANKLFNTYYKKAQDMLNKFINNRACATT